MQLRPYQREAVDSLFEYFRTHPKVGNPIVAKPTGTGKSLVIGQFTKEVLQQWPTQRIMMLTHVKELIQQNAEKLITLWPAAPLGIYSAGLKRKETQFPITFAGIQSARRHAKKFGHIDIIIIDECHLVSPNQEASYIAFLTELWKINKKIRIIGLTATKYRLGQGLLTNGGIFTDVCFDITGMHAFNRLIDEGYLSPVIPFKTDTLIDLTGVKRVAGEYNQKQLQAASDKNVITEAAIREVLDKADDREYIMVFSSGIKHTEHIYDLLISLGENATIAHSKMGKKATENKEDFGRKKYRWIVSNDMLTTGVDYPFVDCIVMLRATMSPGLWVQMLGRGTRVVYADDFDLSTVVGRLEAIAAGPKQNCLVFDFAGNTARLGPINDPVIPKERGKGTGEIPIRICSRETLVKNVPGCAAYNHISARFCCNCKEEFSFKVKLVDIASKKELIRKKAKPIVKEFKVTKIVYAVHPGKEGRADSMKVTYHCGMRPFPEYVPAWHTSSIRHKGIGWWRHRTDLPLPKDAKEAVALCESLRKPVSLRVKINSKYPDIMEHKFK